MPEIERKEKFLLLSGLILVSSYIIYKSLKTRIPKKNKYNFLEAVLVDLNSL